MSHVTGLHNVASFSGALPTMETRLPSPPPLPRSLRDDRISGCLFGAAVGDALGWPVQFDTREDIRRSFGVMGISELIATRDGIGAITDDTQMTLFTAEGLLLAASDISRITFDTCQQEMRRAYRRWLVTQGELPALDEPGNEGWLVENSDLHHRRAPGQTCLKALRTGLSGTLDNPLNASKGCGAVMRSAPVGLYAAALGKDPVWAFELGCRLGVITHGHPTGYLPAGCLAALICTLAMGEGLEPALAEMRRILATWAGFEETDRAVGRAIYCAGNSALIPEILVEESFGDCRTGEAALAFGIYSSLVDGAEFARGVLYAVNHSGNSCSVGAITGSIVGVYRGITDIPLRWLKHLELRETIAATANRLSALAPV